MNSISVSKLPLPRIHNSMSRGNVCRAILILPSLNHRFVHSSRLAFLPFVRGFSSSTLISSDTEKTTAPVTKLPNGNDIQAASSVDASAGLVSSGSEKSKNALDLNSIFLLSIPLTTRRSFIYCHHHAGLLSKDQLDAVPWLAKSEQKLVGLAIKAWEKLKASNVSVNKKIVSLIMRLLDTIPYNENCLRSFPSKEAMVRETAENLQNEAEKQSKLPRAILTGEIEEAQLSPELLKRIPVYHPQIQQPLDIIGQIQLFKTDLSSHHKKWATICAVGIPVSLPLALLPVMPNVPGFYLAYRLYCHVQALRGARNLGYLIESGNDVISETSDEKSLSRHLSFEAHALLDGPFLERTNVENGENEHMLINAESVDKLVEVTGLSDIKVDLHRAVVQETKRLEKLKETNTN